MAHLGRDEFVLLLEEVNDTNRAVEVAHKILRRCNEPFLIDQQRLYISCSIGISVYPDSGNKAIDLLQHADTALHQIKASGRNDVRVFSHEMNYSTLQRLETDKALHHALMNHDFALHYQPQVSIYSQEITGVEALLRWHPPSGEAISPEQFIPIAEDSGLIHAIGEWVLRHACRQFVRWRKDGIDLQRIAINVSPRQMESKNFSQSIINALEATAMPPECLELEITEHLIMNDLKRAAEVLQSFKTIGCTIAIDDFGTGYSSLSYLKYLPIDRLKIDQSFIYDLRQSDQDRAITKAIISMASGLNINVVAEGVETSQQLEILTQQHCDEYQGYLFSKPLPVKKMSALLLQKNNLSVA